MEVVQGGPAGLRSHGSSIRTQKYFSRVYTGLLAVSAFYLDVPSCLSVSFLQVWLTRAGVAAANRTARCLRYVPGIYSQSSNAVCGAVLRVATSHPSNPPQARFLSRKSFSSAPSWLLGSAPE